MDGLQSSEMENVTFPKECPKMFPFSKTLGQKFLLFSALYESLCQDFRLEVTDKPSPRLHSAENTVMTGAKSSELDDSPVFLFWYLMFFFQRFFFPLV